jgi:hypothetical protein
MFAANDVGFGHGKPARSAGKTGTLPENERVLYSAQKPLKTADAAT